MPVSFYAVYRERVQCDFIDSMKELRIIRALWSLKALHCAAKNENFQENFLQHLLGSFVLPTRVLPLAVSVCFLAK